jgi:hypothetical protein
MFLAPIVLFPLLRNSNKACRGCGCTPPARDSNQLLSAASVRPPYSPLAPHDSDPYKNRQKSEEVNWFVTEYYRHIPSELLVLMGAAITVE